MFTRFSRFGVLAAALILAGGCTQQIRIHQHGLMHDVLSSESGASHPEIALAEVLQAPGAIAIGALAGLKGEITIVDGQAWIARPAGNQLKVVGPLAETMDRAVLLTYAHVDRWRDVELTDELAGAALENEIRRLAVAEGIDVSRPFPFVIEGTARDLQLHAINGMCPMRPGANLGEDQQPWRGTFEERAGSTIVGFYAKDSVGKMTHAGTSIHAHAVLTTDGEIVSGHIERLAIGRGAVLRLPAVRS